VKAQKMTRTGALTGTAFCISAEDLQAVFKKYQKPGIELHVRNDHEKLLFRLEGQDTITRQAAFQYLVGAVGPALIREGVVVPARMAFESLRQVGATVTIAESCTGGLLAKQLTDIPGSSQVFWGGFIVYSDDAKHKLLGIGEDVLATEGAVSESVVKGLASSALHKTGTDFSVAVSGIAGPGGGSAEKPVGTVWLSIISRKGKIVCLRYRFTGSRQEIRYKTTVCAFLILQALILGGDYLDYYRNW
jgi:nicotinamide-nucleotide amidase